MPYLFVIVHFLYGASSSLRQFVGFRTNFILLMSLIQDNNSSRRSFHTKPSVSKWIPAKDSIKINVDASWKGTNKSGGIGVVARSWNGSYLAFVYGISISQPKSSSPMKVHRRRTCRRRRKTELKCRHSSEGRSRRRSSEKEEPHAAVTGPDDVAPLGFGQERRRALRPSPRQSLPAASTDVVCYSTDNRSSALSDVQIA